jgi:TatD DNase family protein
MQKITSYKKFIDSHCHLLSILNDKSFNMKPKQYMEFESIMEKCATSLDGEFNACVNVSCEGFDIKENLEFLEFEKVYGAFGVHPHQASHYSDEMEAELFKANSHIKSVAWGECGLDYFYNNSEKEVQKKVFKRQLECAVELKKPVVIHSRDAAEDTFDILSDVLPRDHKIHLHCFTYDSKVGLEFVSKLLNHFENCFIGFTGVITFKKSDGLREVCASVPIERMLLETDSPYMAPGKFRGKVCHPGMIPVIAKQVADLHKVEIDHVYQTTTNNCKFLYGIE